MSSMYTFPEKSPEFGQVLVLNSSWLVSETNAAVLVGRSELWDFISNKVE